MKRPFLIAAVGVFTLLSLLSPTYAADAPSGKDVDALMRRIMDKAHIPGAAVAIVREGKIEHIAAYGMANTEYGVSATTDTPFQIASATKIYTAVALMRLVEQHKLSLDDKVTKYVPEAPSQWSAVTIRHLATHTSGLEHQEIDTSVITTADALPLAFKGKMVAKPGERAQYGSLDFTVLQHILEKVSGKSFGQVLRDEVFAPAGMERSVFDNAEERAPQRFADDIPQRAEYYLWNGTMNRRVWFLYPQYTYAAGGAYSSISDMAKLIAAIDAGRLLSRVSLSELWTPTRLPDGLDARFGIGWVSGGYRGISFVGHSGGPALSDVMYFPERRLGVMVFTNQKNLFPELASLVADQYIVAPSDYLSGGLQDTAPQLTASARKLLEDCARGSVDGAMLSPIDREASVKSLNGIGPAWIGLFPPISRLLLADDKTSADGKRVRRYRVVFGEHMQVITFTFDRNGLIADVDPTLVEPAPGRKRSVL